MRAKTTALATELRRQAPPAGPHELGETQAFLSWLADEHFTFLGYREYVLSPGEESAELSVVEGSGLGILRGASRYAVPDARRQGRSRWPARPHPLVLTKANSRATVHRPAYLDYVGVKQFAARRHRARRAAVPGPVHDDRLQDQPARHPAAARQGRARAQPRRLPARQPRRQGAHRHPGVPAARPAGPDRRRRPVRDRDRHPRARRAPAGAAVRHRRPARPVRRLHAVPAARPLQHREPPAGGADPAPTPSAATTSTGACSSQNRSSSASTTWCALRAACPTPTTSPRSRRASPSPPGPGPISCAPCSSPLTASSAEASSTRATGRPSRRATAPTAAPNGALDVDRVEELIEAGHPIIDIYRRPAESENMIRCQLLSAKRVSLSDVVPTFEHMGAKVVDERPYEVSPSGTSPVWIYDFGLTCDPQGLARAGTSFADVIIAVWSGAARGRPAQRPGHGRRADRPRDHDHPRRPALPAPGDGRLLGLLHDRDAARAIPPSRSAARAAVRGTL